MTYTNTFERVMIWGLVGLLVIAALPLPTVFAQTVAPVFTSAASANSDASMVHVYWGYSNGTPVTAVTVSYSTDQSFPANGTTSIAGTTSNAGQADIPFSNFTKGMTYYFRVVATNTVGSTTSSVGSYIIPAQAQPPHIVSASEDTSSTAEVKFTLQFYTPPEKVKIQIAYDSNFTQVRPDATFTPSATNIYTIASTASYPLDAGKTYYYKAWATSADGTLDGPKYQYQFMMPSSGVTVSGIVKDSEGQPVPAVSSPYGWAVFLLNDSGGPSPASVNAGADGTFTLTNILPGTYRWNVGIPPVNSYGVRWAMPYPSPTMTVGSSALSGQTIQLVPMPPGASPEVTATTANSISLRWPAVSTPVSVHHWSIRVKTTDGTAWNQWTESNIVNSPFSLDGTQNTYIVSGLNPDTYYTVGVAACSSLNLCSLYSAPSTRPRTLAASTTTTLPIGTITLKGYVRDPAGVAIAGAKLRLSQGTASAETTADAAGYYVFNNLAAGTYTLHIGVPPTNPNFQEKDETVSLTTGPVDRNVQLEPFPAWSVTAPAVTTNGTPTDSTIPLLVTFPSNPPSGYNVIIRYRAGQTLPEADWASATLLTPTPMTASGSLTATGLTKSTIYTFGVKAFVGSKYSHTGYAESTTSGITVPPTTGTGSIKMTVKVESDNGPYVVGAIARLSKNGSLITSGPTSGTGYIEFTNLAAGMYQFDVFPSSESGLKPLGVMDIAVAENTPYVKTVYLGKATTTQPGTLPSGTAGVTGTVRDANRKAISGARVGFGNGSAWTTIYTNNEGAFTITNIAAGQYTYGVEVSGYRPIMDRTVTLTSGSVLVLSDLVLVSSTTGTGTAGLRVTVRDYNGVVVSGATVGLDQPGSQAYSMPTSSSGFVEFINLPAGVYHLGVGPTGRPDLKPLVDGSVTLTENTTVVRDVTLAKSGITPPPGTPRQCSDGLDNDGDGSIDYPNDGSCFGPDDDDELYPPPTAALPVIQRIDPAFGPVGTSIKIFGTGFTPAENTVRMGSGVMRWMPSSNGVITFAVPTYFDPCPPSPTGIICMAMPYPVQPGTYGITVDTPSGSSNSFQFTVTEAGDANQCLPSERPEDWYCVQNGNDKPWTVYSKCLLEKQRIWMPKLVILTEGRACDTITPEPVQTGSVKGQVILKDPLTGTEKGFRSKVYFNPQPIVYTFGSTAPAVGNPIVVPTSEDGFYSIPAIALGMYFVGADAPNTFSERVDDGFSVAIAAGAAMIKNIYFKPIQAAPPIVTKGGTVTGRLTDYNDKPLAGIDVWINPVTVTNAPFMQPQRTNEQGVYTIAGLLPGRYRMGTAVPPFRNDLRPPEVVEVSVAASVVVTQDFRLEKREEQGVGLPPGDASVKGVVKAGDQPLAGATIQLKRLDGNGFGFVQTDPYGIYRFPNIAVAKYHVSVYPPPLYAYLKSVEEDIALPAGGNYKDFTLTPREGVTPTPIKQGTATIRGRVLFRNETGEYPMKTNVYLGFIGQYGSGGAFSQSQTTTEDGAFVFANLPAGTYDLNAVLPPHAADAAFIARDVDFYKITVAASEERVQDIVFKKGRIVPQPIPLPIENIEQQYVELRRVLMEHRQMLENMIRDLEKRGGAVYELVAVRDQLKLFLDKAETARKANDRETLRSIFIELERLELTLKETIERLFRTAGNTEFIIRVKGLLADAPKYIREMQSAIDRRGERGEDVGASQAQLDAVEELRARAQALFDAGKIERVSEAEEGAGDLAFRMLDRGQQLYCALGLGGGSCAVKLAGPVKTPDYIRTTLGKTADKQYKALVKNVVSDSAAQFAFEQVLPTLSPEQMRAMFAVNKTAPTILKPIVEHLDTYDADDRAKVLEINVETHSAVQDLREAQEVLDEIAGISRAARESVDNLRKQLEKFIFPTGTGELILEELRTLNDTIVNGTIQNPRRLNAYIQSKFATINVFLPQAVQEKFEKGYIPAKNIQESSAYFVPATTLRERGALTMITNKKGEVPLGAQMAGSMFVRFFETSFDDHSVIAGAMERRLLRAKTVSGQDVMLVLIEAFDLDAPARVRQNRGQLATFMSRELGMPVTAAQLAKPITNSQAIAFVGAAVEKLGVEEEVVEAPVQ